MSVLVSVIIPCYNCSKYIERCVLSFRNQSFTNFEIVAVNDGSTDASLSILKQLILKEPRLKVVDQENAGVSSARNRGVCEAKGKYLVFCDSDDFVGPEYLSNFFSVQFSVNDLIIQYPSFYDEENRVIEKNDNIPIIGKYKVSEGIIKTQIYFAGYPFGKLFNKSIIDKYSIRFRNDIDYKEDLIFLLEYLKYISNIVVCEGRDYLYCRHNGSLSNRWKNPDIVIKINSIIHQLISQIVGSDKGCFQFDRFCIAEVIFLIYHAPANYYLKIDSLRLLRKNVIAEAYPIENQADRILKFLFKNNWLHIYNFTKMATNIILKFYK